LETVSQKTTMSIREMGRILGLGKTESYYLAKKGYFKLIRFYNTTRVDIASFEEWYNSQIRYRKAEGVPPRKRVENAMTLKELTEELGLSYSSAKELVRRKLFPVSKPDGMLLIDRAGFEAWYNSQFRYWKADGTPPGTDYPETISTADIAYMLDVSLRSTVYPLLAAHPEIKRYTVDHVTRVDAESFELWYDNQSRYRRRDE